MKLWLLFFLPLVSAYCIAGDCVNSTGVQVVLVNTSTFSCGGVQAAGCAYLGQNKIAIANITDTKERAVVLWHEYAHIAGYRTHSVAMMKRESKIRREVGTYLQYVSSSEIKGKTIREIMALMPVGPHEIRIIQDS